MGPPNTDTWPDSLKVCLMFIISVRAQIHLRIFNNPDGISIVIIY